MRFAGWRRARLWIPEGQLRRWLSQTLPWRSARQRRSLHGDPTLSPESPTPATVTMRWGTYWTTASTHTLGMRKAGWRRRPRLRAAPPRPVLSIMPSASECVGGADVYLQLSLRRVWQGDRDSQLVHRLGALHGGDGRAKDFP